jgi:acyl-CoA thioesterase-2
MPIDYEVERVRDGGSFSVRRVTARQEGKEILTCCASFQTGEAGLEHQFDMPKVPAPETLKTEQELGKLLAPHVSEALHHLLTRDRPIELRPVAPGDPLRPESRPPRSQDWVRVRGTLPDDPVLHRCLLAYASDFSFLGTSLVPHGVKFWDAGLRVASLDHAMWFHSDFRIDDWLLYDKDSPNAAAGRGLNRGTFYNASGKMVASCAQEGLIRLRKKG